MVQLLAAGKTEEEAEQEIEEKGPPYHYLEQLDGSHLSDFNAKCTLREMSANPTFCTNEEFLHAVRCLMLTADMSFESTLNDQLEMNPFAKDPRRVHEEAATWTVSFSCLVSSRHGRGGDTVGIAESPHG